MSPASPHRRAVGRRRLALFPEYANARTGPGPGAGPGRGPNRHRLRAARPASTYTAGSSPAGADGWSPTL